MPPANLRSTWFSSPASAAASRQLDSRRAELAGRNGGLTRLRRAALHERDGGSDPPMRRHAEASRPALLQGRTLMASPASNRYSVAPLFCRPWTLNGISPRLIESHYETQLRRRRSPPERGHEELEALDPATTPAESISRLKRDERRRAQLDAAARALLREPGRRRPSRRRRPWPRRSPATSDRSTAGGGSSWRSPTVWPAAQAGCCSPTSRATGGSSTTPAPTTTRASPAGSRSWRSTCTSTPITSTSAPTPTAYVAAFMRNIDWSAVRAATRTRPRSRRRGRSSRSSSPTCRR